MAGFDTYSKAWMFITRDEFFNIQKIKQALEEWLKDYGRDAKLITSAGAAASGANDEIDAMAKTLVEEWKLVDPTKGFGVKDVHNLLAEQHESSLVNSETG